MQEHERWLTIAKDDLRMAKLAFPQELFAPLTYHCQQAAEKSFKGYLVFKKQPITKTHDLGKLLEICLSFDKKFKRFDPAVFFLTPYATRFRYPSEFEIPDLNDAKLAIKYAESIMRFVLKKISEPSTGQTKIF